MKKILLVCIFTLLANKTLAYEEFIDKTIEEKKVQVIKVVLDGKHKIITTNSTSGDTLENLVKQEGGISGVNGAYFCPADYKKCGGINYTTANTVYQGTQNFKYKEDFGARGMFGFDRDSKPLFILNNFGYIDGINRKYRENEINNLNYGIANFPVLVFKGKNVIGESEKLLDEKMKTEGIKSFICSNKSGNTVYMGSVSNMTVAEMPDYIINNFNCYHAINLDSGASLGMIYDNETIKKPSRKIMDAFVVIPINPDENEIIKNNYKKIFIKKYKKAFSKLSYEQLKAFDTKITKRIEYIKTLKLKQIYKDKIIAQLTALLEIVNERIDEL